MVMLFGGWRLSLATVVFTLVTTVPPAVVPAAPAVAGAVNPLERCLHELSSYQNTFNIPGTGLFPYTSPPGYLPNDLLSFRTTGSIDVQPGAGAVKGPDGDPVNAPTTGGWPAPGLRQFALLMRVRQGQVRLESNGSVPDGRTLGGTMVPWRWYVAGSYSGCLRILENAPPSIEFLVNEPYLTDNSGRFLSVGKHWW
ncbi:hypothetical protein GCM10022252_41520 [Streptosporangium oxazolinicum]|uniref:Uncharacterized protein n=1 Tax=Streptosporangium oxazolinicum TaxID=909287 RepID=A0ABP8B177_9ACTN